MKFIIILIICITTSQLSIAQAEKYAPIMNVFKEKYNSGQYEAIFNLFASAMKEALPLEYTQTFLADLKTEAGNILNSEYAYQNNENYAVFKTSFEKSLLAICISVDDKNNINGFNITEFKEQKTAVNALNNLPKDFSTIIFEKTKDFPNNTQLAIAVIQNGTTNYYGIIKRNDTLKQVNNAAKIFAIGSITKVFTATVLADLVVNKKTTLIAPINKYFNFSFKNNATINLQSLANHTSGLPALPTNFTSANETNPYKDYTSKNLDAYLLNNIALNTNDSNKYSYSNLGVGLLGHTLSLITKTKFVDLLKNKIFTKYKMTNTFTSNKSLEKRIVQGLDASGNETSNWDFDVLFGCGGILSTVEDLNKFAKAQFVATNKTLALTRTPTYTVNKNMRIGLGWHIIKTKTNQELVWHNGGTGGYSSSMALNIAPQNGVIILSNVSAFHAKARNIDAISFELMNTINK
jgi:CubicO group peptidase (beta-lactamase class C family)